MRGHSTSGECSYWCHRSTGSPTGIASPYHRGLSPRLCVPAFRLVCPCQWTLISLALSTFDGFDSAPNKPFNARAGPAKDPESARGSGELTPLIYNGLRGIRWLRMARGTMHPDPQALQSDRRVVPDAVIGAYSSTQPAVVPGADPTRQKGTAIAGSSPHASPGAPPAIWSAFVCTAQGRRFIAGPVTNGQGSS
jgi:hypothetical protein